jgi:hypothetical protein
MTHHDRRLPARDSVKAAPAALAEFTIAGACSNVPAPGTPNAAPKHSTVVLTCYFASVINLGRGVPTGR